MEKKELSKNAKARQPLPQYLATARETWMATEILPRLFLGDLNSSAMEHELKQRKITHVLVVSGDASCEEWFPHLFTYKRVRVNDVENEDLLSHFDACNQFIEDGLNSKQNSGVVLVHCLGGVSRSASVVISYVMKHQKLTCEQATAMVRGKRGSVRPNRGFRDQLHMYHAMGCCLIGTTQAHKQYQSWYKDRMERMEKRRLAKEGRRSFWERIGFRKSKKKDKKKADGSGSISISGFGESQTGTSSSSSSSSSNLNTTSLMFRSRTDDDAPRLGAQTLPASLRVLTRPTSASVTGIPSQDFAASSSTGTQTSAAARFLASLPPSAISAYQQQGLSKSTQLVPRRISNGTAGSESPGQVSGYSSRDASAFNSMANSTANSANNSGVFDEEQEKPEPPGGGFTLAAFAAMGATPEEEPSSSGAPKRKGPILRSQSLFVAIPKSKLHTLGSTITTLPPTPPAPGTPRTPGTPQAGALPTGGLPLTPQSAALLMMQQQQALGLLSPPSMGIVPLNSPSPQPSPITPTRNTISTLSIPAPLSPISKGPRDVMS